MNELRCAFCHDALVEGGTGADERVECAGCKTVLHWDCRALLARCPTIGCVDATFKKEGRVAVMRPAFRAALSRLVSQQPVTESGQRSLQLNVLDELDRKRCPVCTKKLVFDIWKCQTCGTRAHRVCRAYLDCCPTEVLHSGDGTFMIDEKKRLPGDGRDPETFKSALDRLKKRPPRT